MKFTHMGRLVMTLEFLQEMAANMHLHQAVALAMSPFVVIEARVNPVDNTLEQVIYDPSGLRLPRVVESDRLPRVTLVVTKSAPASLLSIYDNPFSISIKLS